MEPYAEVHESYRTFADEARDSPTFADWALQVSEDDAICVWIASLPAIKQQPNLVFAAARWHGVEAPGPYAGLREALLRDDGAIRETILTRATQTNEVGRLATLVPAFAHFPGPLALIEVGASAGLCLYPDRWGYSWEHQGHMTRLGPEPTLACSLAKPAPLPDALPEIAWRAGVDLNPLNVADNDQMAWLQQLVWPEQKERRERLARAIDIARAEPPMILQGDLLIDLPRLIEQARPHGTVVVFHSAVIAYLEPEDRLRFDAMMRELVASGQCHWVSNEGKRVLESITLTGPPIPPEHPTFVLGIDGQMVAQTHGHGRSMRWTAASVAP